MAKITGERITVMRGVTGDLNRGYTLRFEWKDGRGEPAFKCHELTESEAMHLEDALYEMRHDRSKRLMVVPNETP